jgi:predicted SAM-dependent methyltransferase
MNASSEGTRTTFKRVLHAVLPDALFASVLGLWRKVYWWYRNRPRPAHNRRIAAQLVASGRVLKLELGSAKRAGMEDWIAADLGGGGDIALDFTKTLPFPDASIECIYSSHVLEHFSYPQPMLGFLGECHRILRDGGSFSLAVPDARIFIAGYNNPQDFDKALFCSYDTGLSLDTPIDYVNFIAYNGGDHKHLFDDRNLLTVLSAAGFRDATLRKFDPRLDLSVRRHESLYACARK